jgi:pilus assembly protein Flp/PilA
MIEPLDRFDGVGHADHSRVRPRGAGPITTVPLSEEPRMTKLLNTFWKDESGQGLSEYALLLGLIVIGVVAFISAMGDNIETIFSEANTDMSTAANKAKTG